MVTTTSNDDDIELKELWEKRMEMAKDMEREIKELKLSKESNILGKVLAEMKSLQRASRKLSRSSIDDGNLRHLRNVLDVSKNEYNKVIGLLRSFVLVSPQEGELYKHIVDIVADGGATWAKVISRTAKGVAMDWLTSSPRTIIHQGQIYLDHSSLFPHDFNPPQVIFHFTNGVPHLVSEKLERMGIIVIGERVPLDTLCSAPSELLEELMRDDEIEDDIEEDDDDYEVIVSSSSLSNNISSLTPINLDVSTVFVLITNLTHPGGVDHKFSSKLLREQSIMERKKEAKNELMKVLDGREWIICNTALNAVQSIVSTVGGPTEKSRWNDLYPRLKVVQDDPSPRSLSLEQSAKVNDRAIKIFGTGDSLQYITATANKHFIQSSFHQGVHFAVIIHESRALSEEKELPL